MAAQLKELVEAVVSGNFHKVKEEVKRALKAGVEPVRILTEGFVRAMDVVSEKFEHNEIYVTDLIITARALHMGLNELKPYMVTGEVQPIGRAVIGTVQGDIHDIGKNLVGIMLEASGFEVIDLGVNVPPSSFVEAVVKYRPHVLCLSALLSSTTSAMGETIRALEEAGLRHKVKVVVGGTPLNAVLAASMGADGYAPDAASAVLVIKELIGADQRRRVDLEPATLRRALSGGSVEELQRSFRRLARLEMVILDAQGNPVSPLGSFLDCSQLCRMGNASIRTAASREEITTYVGSYKGAFVYRCPAGLVEISYPLASDEGSVGALLCGHCLLEGDDLGELAGRIPVLSLADLEAVCGLLSFMGGQIVQLVSTLLACKELEEERNGFVHFLQKQHQLEQALKDAEFRVLQSQVNPHFLFNSLNAITRLALLEGAKVTEKMVGALARLLRYTLYQIKGLVTLREELRVVEDYLFIQQTRFSDRLVSEIEVEPRILEARVPCMVLQPLVENAVIHGLEPLKEGGIIYIKGRLVGSHVHLEVRDTGVGIPEDKQKEIFDLEIMKSGKGQLTGLGLVHVYRRLQHYFGAECALNIFSQPGEGTSIQLTFPFVKGESSLD